MTNPTVLTLEEVDKLLADWRVKRFNAGQNVLELMNNTTYKALSSGGFSGAKLSGLTEERCTPALKALSELWGLFAELGRVLDQATVQRTAVKGRAKPADLQALSELLLGPSVKFSVQLPFSQRTLIAPAEVTNGLSLVRVLELMTQAYEQGRDVVLEIERTISRLHDGLSASVSEVESLRALARSLGENTLPELDTADAKINQSLDLIYSDPLGVKAGFDADIEPLVRQARVRVNGVKELYEQVKRDIALARSTMQSLADTHKKATDAFIERCEKVWQPEPDTLPQPPDISVITGLEEWLVRLETGLREGKWKPLRMGVANWSLQATERLLACQKACSANLEPLNQRRELRAMLDGLKAKAQACGLSEDEELAKIEKAARAVLYTRPTRLAEAEKLVKEYAANLR